MLENQGYPEPSTCLEIEIVVPLRNHVFFSLDLPLKGDFLLYLIFFLIYSSS